jgi:RNA polymerase sigma factor (sigma-70 family)
VPATQEFHDAIPPARLSASGWAARSDEQLVALVREGDPRAFEVLAARYRARLLRLCRQILKSDEDGEDALQDVFIAAFKAIIADEREIHVRPWLYRIATNRCINQLRRSRKIAFEALDDLYAAGERTLVEEIVSREDLRELVRDIRALPARQRTALVLCEVDGFNYDDIASAMTTTMPAVKSLLVRARSDLFDAAAVRRGGQSQAPGSTRRPRLRQRRG